MEHYQNESVNHFSEDNIPDDFESRIPDIIDVFLPQALYTRAIYERILPGGTFHETTDFEGHKSFDYYLPPEITGEVGRRLNPYSRGRYDAGPGTLIFDVYGYCFDMDIDVFEIAAAIKMQNQGAHNDGLN